MTEPVAWRVEDVSETLGWRYSTLKPITKGYEPLYTAEQLHPRVKMTQAEFDEWKELYEDGIATTIYDFIIYVLNRRDSFPDMTNKLMHGSGAVKAKSQAKIADLIVNYNPDTPEETIEIVPTMKWFVRSKEKENGHYQVLAESRVSDMPRYTLFKSYAMTFDTKEEAELWKNPLTEAVQLEVGEEL